MNLKKSLTRILSIFLVLLVVFGLAFTTVASADEKTQTQGEPIRVESKTVKKSYEIAVAYDNSGSMYNNEGSWYQAKYAMEIFASMLNLTGGDKLTIFPMWEVTAGSNQLVKRIEVKSVADIDKIHNMCTDQALGTPYKAVTDAHSHLRASKAEERWLIILTDGTFDEFWKNSAKLQPTLENLAKNGVKVRYIPFGGVVLNDNSPNDDFYASPAVTTEEQLRNALIESCNTIFQRDELKNRLTGQELKIDLSMKKLIVFVQGKDAAITSLKDASGNEVKTLMNSGKRTYSDLGAKNYPDIKLPEELKQQSGQVVTFGACKQGTYTLEYSNADNIQIFYEPDVTMLVSFVDDDGVIADFKDGEFEAKEYTCKVELVDSETGQDVTNHELMGGNVTISGTAKYKDGKTIDFKNGDKVNFEVGDSVELDVSAEYLGKYKLSTKDHPDIDFSNLNFIPPYSALKITAEVLQPSEWYTLSEHKGWKPIKVKLTMDGEPLTDEQLEAATLEFTATNKNGTKLKDYRIEKLKGESAINVYIAQDENGKYIKPEKGKYTCEIKATAPDEYNEIIESNTITPEFKIRRFPLWLVWLIIIAIAVAVIFICGIPVKPKRIYISDGTDDGEQGPFNLSQGLSVDQVDNIAEVAFTASSKVKMQWFKNSWLKNVFGSSSMTFIVTGIDATVEKLSIENGETIGNLTNVTWKEPSRTFNGYFYINKRP